MKQIQYYYFIIPKFYTGQIAEYYMFGTFSGFIIFLDWTW